MTNSEEQLEPAESGEKKTNITAIPWGANQVLNSRGATTRW